MKTATAFDPATWLNVWVTNVDYGYSFGTFPFDPDALEATGGIVMGHFHWSGNFSAFAHEIGHCLGLWHNFHGVSEVSKCGPCYESVNASQRDRLGDLCADTPPTSVWYECSDATDIDSCSGLPWESTQPENCMGYTPVSCRNLFTPQQQGRMRCWFYDRLSGWLNGVMIHSDTLLGTAPFPVQITAVTSRQVDVWTWDMGDQSTENEPVASHTYATPGVYSVKLKIETPLGVFSDSVPDMVWVHADTASVARVLVNQPGPIRVDLSIHNFIPLSDITLPVTWSAVNNLQLDSISTVDLRGSSFDLQSLFDLDNTLRHALVRLTPGSAGEPSFLEPGNGPVAALFFTAPSDVTGTSWIALSGYDEHTTRLVCGAGSYTPEVVGGAVIPPCCQERVGNPNGLGTFPYEVTIGDIQTLIVARFIEGTCDGYVDCISEGDVNQSGGTVPTCEDVTISDVQVLVNHLFIAGPANAPLNDCL